MEKNSKIAPKKESNQKTPKMKRKNSKNKKLNMKDYANQLKKSQETKLKKLYFPTELKTPHVFQSLVNTDGQPIWKES